MRKLIGLLIVIAVLLGGTTVNAQKSAASSDVKVVSLNSPSSLYEIQVMFYVGSAHDAVGKEGLANLAANALIEGGFGDPKDPVTKEKVAEITRPWGEAATPSVRVDKQATTFSMTVPREVFPQFVNQVLKPMFTAPLFQQPELDRLKKEALTAIQSGLRFEQQEQLGLLTLDNYVFAGTSLQNLASGTVTGLQAVTRDELMRFHKTFYNRAHVAVATSFDDAASLALLKDAFPAGSGAATQLKIALESTKGNQLLIVTQPNAIATGLHLGFPITLKRGDDDYWPLFIANTILGLHRDDFGRMYQDFREARGYNYGDYSYIEYYASRPYQLFPPPTTPRSQQYFSIWIRPVAHQYAHFMTKAMTAQLARLFNEGLKTAEVEEAKVKVRTLYLNYAESKGRQLGYKLDDLFYGMSDRSYIDTMLKSIDSVTSEKVNAAIKRHLQLANLKYVIVTNESEAQRLADDIAHNKNVLTKTPEEYHIPTPIPPDKQALLDQDKKWAEYPLSIPRENIRIVKSEQLFETAGIPGVELAKPATGGADQ